MVLIKKFGVDIGYGYTKAVSENEKLAFPSVIADKNGQEIDVFSVQLDYEVEIKYPDGKVERKLVGESATRYLTAVSVMTREKPAEIHDLLLYTAIYLLGGGGNLQDGQVEVCVGLPLAFYKSQKAELKARLERSNAFVRVGSGEQRYISIAKATVIPQGAGVIFANTDTIPDDGLCAVIDVGTYTTDFLLFEMQKGRAIPLLDACGSVEAGISFIHRMLMTEFQNQTGEPLPAEMVQYVINLIESGKPVIYGGKAVNLMPAYQKAKENTAIAISQKVLNTFGNRTKFINPIFLAGGGAVTLQEELKKHLPNAVLTEEPFYSNAIGYLKVIS
ncbi:ParM/StbA family protein [Carboxydothermus ferrireducens]|uniref:Plasmid segregation protein ParM n=1 Tax=Carboxydothermus ferrireducens DSM 11255 TaxID=1119529 RepID=A0ABX2R7M5_9THEO|nr:ParM/StbA family protein [Carboxydothermus ferrireducens]NYE57164.1 plasmid segregation protein ParM [Carboxydothermus ferrireducens DSM 11255]